MSAEKKMNISQCEEQIDRTTQERKKFQAQQKNKSHSEYDGMASSNFRKNCAQSHVRNQKLLKDLELTKARLRTFSAYTPTDQQLLQLAAIYRTHLHTKIHDLES